MTLFLLTAGPESLDSFTVHRWALGLRALGEEVEIFLMDDGVLNAAKGRPRVGPDFAETLTAGARITLCAASASARSLPEAGLLEEVVASNQYDLSAMVRRSDRFLTFTG